MRYDHYESLRQERLKLLMEERRRLVAEFGESGAAPSGRSRSARPGSAPASSAAVDREKYKLEVLKRRQEKELQQVRGRPACLAFAANTQPSLLQPARVCLLYRL